MNAALEQADKVAAYKGLSMKDALHLRLLTEEMMGLMRSITGEREGIFWIEDEDGEYRLHLQVRTLLNSEEREQLLAVSSTGKNESAKGLMGRIRDFFDWGSDEDLATFIRIEYGRVGADTRITPREIIRDFIELLDILYQNPGMTPGVLLDSDEFSYAKSDAVSDEAADDFAEFTV